MKYLSILILIGLFPFQSFAQKDSVINNNKKIQINKEDTVQTQTGYPVWRPLFIGINGGIENPNGNAGIILETTLR